MRDLTRYRVKLVEERNRIHNRIHKVLEDACIKLATVATDILGASGRAMIPAMISGEEDASRLADRAQGRLRGKRQALRLAAARVSAGSSRADAAKLMEAATRKSNCYLAAFFYRKAGKQGIRKAIVATAQRILTIAFCMLRDQTN